MHAIKTTESLFFYNFSNMIDLHGIFLGQVKNEILLSDIRCVSGSFKEKLYVESFRHRLYFYKQL